ncbi:hypothetical protein B1A99_22965 [Cohnella sp. CIP 111063]|uniref:beta-galactosidase n=1 Tax=unclassified Cohnella TaxID=2636738 RepID=UPI000B8C0E81|nr:MULTISPECIES: beta-galactosidase [unclassified Cohnella]OXS55583.1 hypothetical protein B1A99_22965 [Cohnella sp. CIP 111063]PRX66427.1 beta-galactosidase [Cohnella sp. SGD-V74]
MLFGACYYPEHWPRERWDADAKMMREANFNVVRMAEFAWIKMEPEEGRFDFAWLDDAVALFASRGIQTILGTPTAGPPKWLLDKYPDIYQRDFQGHALGFGTRRSYCANNPVYREYTRRIVAEMAGRYASRPEVIGWQIDNELGAIDTARCYCEHCRKAFIAWLQEKYASLGRLNEEWGTIFSSQLYTDWEQLHLPAYSVHQGHNPGMALDFRRFSSDSFVGYQKLQIDVLREHGVDRPITSNLMGSFNDLDYYDLAQDMDLVSLDIYPIMKKVPEERPFRTGLNHDSMRGLKGRNYWVLEHQSGTPCTHAFSQTPKPGELRRWTYQSVARGADAIVYFRWRTLPYGLEEFWHGILQHHGKPGRKYAEVRQVGAELARLADKLRGTTVKAKAAIVKCFHNEWAFELQPHAPGFVYKDHLADYYRYFFDRHIPVDIVSPDTDDFSGYDLVVLPNLMMARDSVIRRIHEYVRKGGTVVMDFRAGAKEWNNRMREELLPGPYAELLGIEIDDYGIIEEENPNGLAWNDAPPSGRARTWYEVIEPKGAETVVRFTDDYFAGGPAVTRHRYGAGSAYYIGTEPDAATLNALFGRIAGEIGLSPALPELPQGVEAVVRSGEAEDGRVREFVFLINHLNGPVSFRLSGRHVDLLSGEAVEGAASLEPNGVMVLEKLG